MIRVKGHYRDARIHLASPLDLPDGVEVEVIVHTTADEVEDEWRNMGMQRLEQEWDNKSDAVYDDWRRLYGVRQP